MTDWYLMKPQPTLNSGFEYDEFEDYAQDGFDELLTETQLGKQIKLCKGRFDGENFETEIETEGIVQSETPDAYTQGWKRQLLTRISDNVNDYKYIKYDNMIWIIITEPADNCIYDKCVIHLCNWILKWQDSNREILHIPTSIENASQYNTGEAIGKIITLGSNQVMSYVSLDEDTVHIRRGQRFFIDYNSEFPIVYKCTRPDTVAYSYGKNRVMSMVLTEDQFNPNTDSIENMVCDYFVLSDITISYKGKPTIRVGGLKTLTAEIENMVTWSVESDIGAYLSVDGNVVKVHCPNVASNISKDIVVKATLEDSEDEISSECVLTVVGGA